MEELLKSKLNYKIFLSKQLTKLTKGAFSIKTAPGTLLDTSTVKDIAQLCHHQKINPLQDNLTSLRKTPSAKNHIPKLC